MHKIRIINLRHHHYRQIIDSACLWRRMCHPYWSFNQSNLLYSNDDDDTSSSRFYDFYVNFFKYPLPSPSLSKGKGIGGPWGPAGDGSKAAVMHTRSHSPSSLQTCKKKKVAQMNITIDGTWCVRCRSKSDEQVINDAVAVHRLCRSLTRHLSSAVCSNRYWSLRIMQWPSDCR